MVFPSSRKKISFLFTLLTIQRCLSSEISIRVGEQGWGKTDASQMKSRLVAITNVWKPSFPKREPVAIYVEHHAFDQPEIIGAMVLYEKNSRGEYVVQLSVKDSQWEQMTYQFSHELCHIYSNFDVGTKGPTLWFDETICEVFSLVTLKHLGMQRYLDHVLKAPNRELPAGMTFKSWYLQNRPHLELNSVDRGRTAVVTNILLTLVEGMPITRWGALATLNLSNTTSNYSLPQRLENWLQRTTEHRSFIQDIRRMFDGT